MDLNPQLTHLLQLGQSRALQVSPRAEQHEQRDVHRQAQEALHRRLPSPSSVHADRRLPDRPALLQPVPDAPQARGEQLGHGARGGSVVARAAAGVTWPQQGLVCRQPAHGLTGEASAGFSLFRSVFLKGCSTLPLLIILPHHPPAPPDSPHLSPLDYSLVSHG